MARAVAAPAQDDPPGPPSEPPPAATETAPAPFEPITVLFHLTDGVRVKGELTTWDDEGIDGTFGRRDWTEIDHRDIRLLQLRLMKTESAAAWVELGRVLLLASLEQPKAEKLAERAFARALRIDPESEAMIQDAREEAEDTRDLRETIEAAIAAERLRSDTPEGRKWDPTPWPELSAEEQASAVGTMRADAARILERAGLSIVPVETEYFLFYSDMPRRESDRWVRELDVMYAKLAKRFDLDPDDNIFWGKAAIFVFSERDRFRLVEAESFGHLVPEWADGICHPVGPKVFVNFYRLPRTEVFAAVLVHETVHGFMHRYRTPRRLPTWANEGIADYFASVLFRRSPMDAQRRTKGLRFIRSGGDVNGVLDMSYRNGGWPGPNEIGYNIGYLLVELMVRDRPKAFGQWVRAIKAGKQWEEALLEDFGVNRETLVARFIGYYRVND